MQHVQTDDRLERAGLKRQPLGRVQTNVDRVEIKQIGSHHVRQQLLKKPATRADFEHRPRAFRYAGEQTPIPVRVDALQHRSLPKQHAAQAGHGGLIKFAAHTDTIPSVANRSLGIAAAGRLPYNTRMFTPLLQHRHLTWELAKREFQDRFIGHILGWVWVVLQPVLFMSIQIFVFACIFRVSLAAYPHLPYTYATYVLAGMIPWYYTQELLMKSCQAVSSQAGLVKQVVFPIEVLPLKTVVATLLPQLIAIGLFMLYTLVTFGALSWTYLLLPPTVLLQSLFLSGIACLLSAIGVYVRDIRDIIQSMLMAALYLLPVFYLPDMVPGIFRYVLWLNPFSYMVWVYQDILYFGSIAHPEAWLVFIIESFVSFAVGSRVFHKLKIMFGSHL